MLNDQKITFRSIYGRKPTFTPEYMHDVIAMRKHPDYEEITADGDVVAQPEDGVQRPLISVPNAKTLNPAQPKARARKGK